MLAVFGDAHDTHDPATAFWVTALRERYNAEANVWRAHALRRRGNKKLWVDAVSTARIYLADDSATDFQVTSPHHYYRAGGRFLGSCLTS